MYHIFKATSTNVLRGLQKHLKICYNCTSVIRNYADTSQSESKSKRGVVKVQGTDTEPRLRVRFVRPSDVHRILSFVREHSQVWPGPLTPQSDLVLGDYVARTLAQGHSILAERHPNTLRPEIRGLALVAALCPWDADLLERWAPCLRCRRAQRLVNFTAYCLRAPMLHDKYQVQNVLQVILIVPPDTPKNAEIIHILAKHAIKRGVHAGFQLLRFDATQDCIANSLEELMLKKEWSLSYQIIPETQVEYSQQWISDPNRGGTYNNTRGKIVVYSALINSDGRSSQNAGGQKPGVPPKTPVLAK